VTPPSPAPNPLVIVSTIRRRPGHQREGSSAVRPSHVATMLALAHHLRQALDDGATENRAEIARALGVQRPRVTQILDLLHLAPDLQEIVIATQAVGSREPMTERGLRSVVGAADWHVQRQRFAALRVLRQELRGKGASRYEAWPPS
jgi:ParB-like chromosome segregation protein Spo0J